MMTYEYIFWITCEHVFLMTSACALVLPDCMANLGEWLCCSAPIHGRKEPPYSADCDLLSLHSPDLSLLSG